jgi:hypothetical protein
MSCSKCKKKEEREFIEKEINRLERPVQIFVFAGLALTLYGIVSLVIKVVSLF